jgi:hypothetical protein
VTFDRSILERWQATAEIGMETSRAEGAAVHHTVIWIVVDDNTAYVRSVRGPAGRWYRELVANPRGAVLVGDERVAMRAEPAIDPETVERVSAAIERKYQSRWPGPAAAMLRPETLPTTLRLVPD